MITSYGLMIILSAGKDTQNYVLLKINLFENFMLGLTKVEGFLGVNLLLNMFFQVF